MAGWQDDVPGREPPPDEWVLEEESTAGPAPLSGRERKVVEKTWRELRRLQPHLYAVFKSWAEHLELRESDSQYSHGLYRGFYADMALRLGITRPAVKYRLKRAQLWFARRLERNDLRLGRS